MTGMTAIIINYNWILLIALVLWTLAFAPPLYGIWLELRRQNNQDAEDRRKWDDLPIELDDEATEKYLDKLLGDDK